MKIQFDSALAYQRQAIEAITGIFEGQEKCEANFTVYSPRFIAQMQQAEFNDIGFRNMLHDTLTEGRIVENMQKIQLANGLKPSTREDVDMSHLDFTIEMETGTGKTYVYLRTIMDLYVKYGFSKHIIVVPSIPIKEGVYKSLQITQEHLKQLYNNVDYDYFIYDSSKLGQVRNFATSDKLQIMVINIDSFSKSFQNPEDHAKKANLIHRYNDKLGYIPIELIRNAQPFVFVDEPQSTINTPIRKKAIKGLNPLAVIRYSATHREKINQMYKLDAVDAYEEKLVKQIEVGSVMVENNRNQAYLKLFAVKNNRGSIQAQLEFDTISKGSIKRVKKWLKKNADLEEITKRDIYEGYIINDIYLNEGNEYIDFTSREGILRLGQVIGEDDDLQIKTEMIRKTIEEHLEKELLLNPKGIKVLSLFFIDTVSKYRIYDEDGNAQNGIYAEIFEELYRQEIKKPKYDNLFGRVLDRDVDVSAIHNGYFSIDKRPKASNKKEKYECYKDTTGNVKADEDTYSLIMKDKEKLLSFESKLRFIFSHSIVLPIC
jgi:type III restriction enzyme